MTEEANSSTHDVEMKTKIIDRTTRSSIRPQRLPLADMPGHTELSTVIAESVCEMQTPVTVGIYGKWGSGKSRMVRAITERMAALTNCDVQFPRIPINPIVLLFRLLFFKPLLKPNHKKNRVKYIFVSMTALDYVGTDKLWAGIITKISKKIDQAFGRNKVKFFRAAHSHRYSLDRYNQDRCVDPRPGKWQVNPLTAYVYPMVTIVLVAIVVSLIVLYGFPVVDATKTSIGSIFSALFVGAIGVGAVSQFGNVAKVTINLVRTQSQMITKLANRPDFSSSLGFMSKIKTEIRYITGVVAYMSHLTDSEIRICLTIDDIDRLDKKLVMGLFQVVTLLDATPNSPFIQFLSMDPLIVANIVKKALTYELFSNINGHEYIKRIVRIPLNIPILTAEGKHTILHEAITKQLHGNEAWSRRNGNGHFVDTRGSAKPSPKTSKYEPLQTVTTLKNELTPSNKLMIKESAVKFFESSDEYIKCIDDSWATINRILQSVEVSVRLFLSRNKGKIDSSDIENLSSWVILTDQWPYRLSWLWQYVEDNRQLHALDPSYPKLPPTAMLDDIYRIISGDLDKTADWENLIQLDGDPELFTTFLQNYPFQVRDFEKFLPYTINLNFSLKRIVARAAAKLSMVNISAKLGNLRQDIGMHKMMVNWTIDDVCKEMTKMGLEEENVEKYQTAGRDHNITGQVLVSGDLDELKSAFGMTVGDWVLFKMHIKAYRSFYGNPESEIPQINTTGESPMEFPNNNHNSNITNENILDKDPLLSEIADTVI